MRDNSKFTKSIINTNGTNALGLTRKYKYVNIPSIKINADDEPLIIASFFWISDRLSLSPTKSPSVYKMPTKPATSIIINII